MGQRNDRDKHRKRATHKPEQQNLGAIRAAAKKNAFRASRRPLDAPTLMLTVGTLGFMRPASGTWGSLPPAAIVFVMLLAGASSAAITAVMLALALAGTAVCVRYGAYAKRRFRRADAAEVVADETAGCAVAFLLLPAAAVGEASLTGVTRAGDAVGAFVTAATIAAVGFVAFRVFDILKLQPAKNLEGLPGGWGVAVDDLMAGVYAAVVVQVLCRFILV